MVVIIVVMIMTLVPVVVSSPRNGVFLSPLPPNIYIYIYIYI